MKRADLNDLLIERWIRDRENGTLVWVTKEGKEIPIKELSDEHLDNIIGYLERQKEFNTIAAQFDAFVSSSGLD